MQWRTFWRVDGKECCLKPRAASVDFPFPRARPLVTLEGVFRKVFSLQHRVTYSECTLGNHVYYARYLDLLEIVRGEFFRSLGASFLHWQEREVIFPVVEARLRYRSPARYDEVLTLEVWPAKVAGVRLDFAYRICHANDAAVLDAETFHVCTGLNEKPRRMPEELQEALKPYLRTVG
ncbi:MAG: acyl-CoA thioesterase [Verrucomicrobiae bacterium]|nr:acyl-CoA thioesterase [Verrucomicrobiae bacterium]